MPVTHSIRRRIIGAAIAVPLAAIITVPATRQAAWRTLVPRADATESAVALEAVLADRKLHVTMPSGEVKTYNVAIGTRAYPTPTGQFTIRRIIWNPGWVPPNSKWARGKRARGPGDPGNPMKVAKIFFKQPDYYIHGTGHVESLGTAASHGCLRMHPDEVAELGAVLMQAGGVSHDWDWVKRTLRVGETRTINLKQPIRMTVLPSRPEPEPAPAPQADSAIVAPSAAGAIPVGGQGPGDTTTVVDSTSRP
jgi:hypothetical protein